MSEIKLSKDQFIARVAKAKSTTGRKSKITTFVEAKAYFVDAIQKKVAYPAWEFTPPQRQYYPILKFLRDDLKIASERIQFEKDANKKYTACFILPEEMLVA